MTKDLTRWADPAMFGAEDMPKDEGGQVAPRVYLLQAPPDPLGGIAAACMMYEGKVVRNLEDITDEQRRHYWEQVKATHLKAPLEFVQLHFLVEGVTRSFTHQMVRQRTAVYAQESLRFAVKDDLADEVPLPPSLMDDGESGVFEQPSDQDYAASIWTDVVSEIGEAYKRLMDMGVPAEDARGLLPHSTTTRLHYATNLRNLLDHAGNRLCTQAQFEWRFVLAKLVEAIRSYRFVNGMAGIGGGRYISRHAWQYKLIADDGLFKPVCYQLGHCPFTATFDRDCTIRGRVQAGKFEDIDDREWLVDPAAARRG